jgi:hypothetical protein
MSEENQEHEAPATVSPRAKFIEEFVAAKVAYWMNSNNPTGPDHRGLKQNPSKEHLATWATMGAEEATKNGLKE